ncbi:short subunit dehydrogenase [Paraburkholderia sp. BL18I3N2]|uniref:SDR family NAD(P)-dependent oxidoreductase n=1 Tax=Paraburkholderia sp. BL18I3N2 TaxID=1938799 RepID=UPI000D068F86|nr:short subunit dehydrogenase [Paraburkholderia sp. BL18I3N2]
MQRFSEKVVIVTGGSSGLGRASAVRFAQEGAHVVIGGVDTSDGTEIAEEVNGLFVQTDVGDPAASDAAS